MTQPGPPSLRLAATLALAQRVDPDDSPALLDTLRSLPDQATGCVLQRAVRTWALWNAAAEWHRLDPSDARDRAAAHTDPVVRALTTEAFAGRRPEP